MNASARQDHEGREESFVGNDGFAANQRTTVSHWLRVFYHTGGMVYVGTAYGLDDPPTLSRICRPRMWLNSQDSVGV